MAIIRLFITSLILMCYANLLMAQNKVATHEGVTIGGIQQWIGAQGRDDSKPLLLFLHGGPGFSSQGYLKKAVKLLKDDFIVAQWDQRGSGITKAWNENKSPISLELLHSDTKEVVDYLLAKFSKRKLYLVGFSWGAFLGHRFASEHPEQLHAYVAVSPLLSANESDRITLELLKEKASQSGLEEALAEINQIDLPISDWEELYYLRRWTVYFFENKSDVKKYPAKLFESWAERWLPIYTEAAAIDYPTVIPKLECPTYFFLSERDFVANHQLAAAYFQKLEADVKEIVWFYEATHEIPSQNPSKFSKELIKLSKVD